MKVASPRKKKKERSEVGDTLPFNKLLHAIRYKPGIRDSDSLTTLITELKPRYTIHFYQTVHPSSPNIDASSHLVSPHFLSTLFSLPRSLLPSFTFSISKKGRREKNARKETRKKSKDDAVTCRVLDYQKLTRSRVGKLIASRDDRNLGPRVLLFIPMHLRLSRDKRRGAAMILKPAIIAISIPFHKYSLGGKGERGWPGWAEEGGRRKLAAYLQGSQTNKCSDGRT